MDTLASWAIVLLTFALVGVTTYYAVMTARLANLADQDAGRRREEIATTQSRTAIALMAELRLITTQLGELERQWDDIGPLGRNLRKLSRFAHRSKVFDVLMRDVGVLGPNAVEEVVELYAPMAYVTSTVESFIEEGIGNVARGEIEALLENVDLLKICVTRASDQIRPYFEATPDVSAKG